MLTDPLIIGSLERYPASWVVSSTVDLLGACAVTFTGGAEPDASAVFYDASWADTASTQTVINGTRAYSRTTQCVVAGSASAATGDAFPGVGDYTAWIRYTDLGGMVRVRSAGLIRFR